VDRRVLPSRLPTLVDARPEVLLLMRILLTLLGLLVLTGAAHSC
jgi:hypothetical protein